MNRKVVFTALLLTLVLAGLRINLGLAQDTQPVTDDQINEVARQLILPGMRKYIIGCMSDAGLCTMA